MSGKPRKPVVHKSLVMEKSLAGAIGSWAAGANVSFSEAVRLLCSRGLATWPGSPFAAPFGSSQAVVDELHRAEKRVCDELSNSIDEAADDILHGLAQQLAQEVERLVEVGCEDNYDDADNGLVFRCNPVSMMYAASEIDLDEGENEEDGGEYDAAW